MSALSLLRVLAGLSVSEAAKVAGVGESYLARVEAGEAEPSPSWVATVAGSYADFIRDRALARLREAGSS